MKRMIEIDLRFARLSEVLPLPPPGAMVGRSGRSLARRAAMPDPSKSSTTSFPSALAVLRLFSIRRNVDPGDEDLDDDEDEDEEEEVEGCRSVVGASRGHTNVMTMP